MAQPAAPPPPASTRGPRIMLIVGVVLTLLGIGGAVTAAVAGASLAGRASTAVPAVPVDQADGVSALTDLALTAGTRYAVLAQRTGPLVSAGSVRVTLGPPDSATTVPVTTPSDARVAVAGRTYWAIAVFEAPETGRYSVTAASAGSSQLPALTVATYTPPAELALPIVGLTLGIVGAILLGAPGIGLVIAGAVWRTRRRRTARPGPDMP